MCKSYIKTQVNLKKKLKVNFVVQLRIDKTTPRSNFSKLFVFVSHRLGSSLQRNPPKL